MIEFLSAVMIAVIFMQALLCLYAGLIHTHVSITQRVTSLRALEHCIELSKVHPAQMLENSERQGLVLEQKKKAWVITDQQGVRQTIDQKALCVAKSMIMVTG